ncbi:hypothetical protein DCS_07304 [Drechmeria coniospora]|uniref:YAG7-like dimerisation domain-containing protein n=1 Tax=Drechmeria coniospora TaxID=98403 RepID=A0A151GE48_DRECN|nr:hypothetical protein DCS_07304 [Drechmeria coniospora]KYK55341.1 hypothetical protein DCS_07304 [Drechmeria coniospora]ODA82051.1 hypothetical protein RJ55_00556 [Drechmeria coniospora]
MAASTVNTASKTSKKKSTKPARRNESPAPSTASGVADKNDGQDEPFESAFIKELQKNIRNVNKKIAHASKTDGLLGQHAGKSLDELVVAKVINADQKAQIQKKPALQAQLEQFEEQLAQYQKVHEQYRHRAAADKAEWEKSLEKARADAVREAKAEFNKSLRDNLLVLSQFLRLAAYRREEAKDPESDESQAIEGVLLAIYSGDDSAVASMLKLIDGSEDRVLSVPGEPLQTTYSSVKSMAREYKTPSYEEGEHGQDVVTDPTIANATATEMDAGDAIPINGKASELAFNGIANSNVADEAANEVAESHWDGENEIFLSQEWVDVKVPRDPAETDSGLKATPAAAANTNTQSWADDQPDASETTHAPAADANDGFHQVQRNRGRQEREGGNYRGRGRGEWRGRGRGDGRGRGHGRGHGTHNGAVSSRPPRRHEES